MEDRERVGARGARRESAGETREKGRVGWQKRGRENERGGDNAKAGMHAHVHDVFSYVRVRGGHHVRTR